jgi:hypothetical protein
MWVRFPPGTLIDQFVYSIRLSELKVGVIINTSSGGCDSESEQKMLSILNRAGIVESKAWCGAAEEMERSFADAPNTAVTTNA